jgi:hypothetical protein
LTRRKGISRITSFAQENWLIRTDLVLLDARKPWRSATRFFNVFKNYGSLRAMSAASPNMTQSGSTRKPRIVDVEMHLSTYDRVSGVLLALLLLIGGAVGVMFLLWLVSTIAFAPAARPIKLVENIAGRGDHAEGFARDAEAPGEDEMPEFQEPQIETALESVSDVVSTVTASMDVIDTASPYTGKGKGGLGDSRPPGPLGEGENIIPRWERWEIRWTSNSLNAYSQQLDFFKIELGAVGGKKEVDYAFNFAKPKPDTRSGLSKDEKRLYMTWKAGTLKQFDQQLLVRAGIATANRTIMQFYPELVEDTLASIEMENAKKLGHPNTKEFLRTVFGVRVESRGSEFYVIDQRFRPAPR